MMVTPNMTPSVFEPYLEDSHCTAAAKTLRSIERNDTI